ncbi:nuclear pore complex protein Nup93-like [Anthonomus grandis grandis]|uniref:nuclear pore complex protein Nup93-like n=1 Tax=Anthonomus grandis grandis TaxID=2921223 RepID=UPI0021653782|nr:nuclear pore complex protein Nup93-like [Anthonomus grandis grandis]XP_050302656.1 nuclear pore complex protein Nup93-like [Anthonomus grandis grandis]
MADFSDLLKQAEQLTHELEGTSELPRVERSLKQVLDASNDLYSRVAQSGSKDIQANLLLGSKGIDLPKIVQKLESISTKRTFEPIEPIDDIDIANKLKNEIRNKILEAFDSGYREMLESTYVQAWEHQCSEWKQQKRKILNALGGRSGMPIELGKHQSILLERPSAHISHMGPNEMIYASKVIEYNTNLIRGMPKSNLVNVFYGISNEFKDARVKDMWEIIKYMVQLSPFPNTDDPTKGRYSKPIILDLVGQGKKYLEDRYKTYMNNIVNENLVQAGRGGIPGTYPLVRSFVGLRLQGEYMGLRDGLVDDRPLWPMVYYCIRCGDVSAAVYCLKKSSYSEYTEILSILELKLKNPNSPDIQKLEESIRFSYRRFIRNETDPFKRIVWSVLGCCDISDEHSEVARTADDYLWLKLSLVRVDNPKEDHIHYNELQQVILEEYGESHYDAFNQPHLYFQVLALTGQFEAAIEFLSRVERFKVHAVHMAIALNELYLIAAPHDTSAPLIFIDPADPKPARRLNLARLIMVYVRNFEFSCLNEALHYFYFLRNFTEDSGENLFKVCVADLAIHTKEYEKLLGKIQRNGIRTKGLVDQFADSGVTADGIAAIIGNNLVKKGLHEEAIDIFDIANNQEEILTFLCTMLSQVVQSEGEPGSLRARLYDRAIVFADRFSREGYRCNSSLVNSFLKLKELINFFDLYHAKEYAQALKMLNDLQLVPFRMEDVNDRVQTFKGLTAEVCKVIPDVLLATMNMLFAQYQKIKANSEFVPRYQDGSVEMQLSYLRQQAKALTNYAGMLPYRLPGDTNSRLVQMEILMH